MMPCAPSITVTPLDALVAEQLGLSVASLSRPAIENKQLEQLNATLDWARSRSPFYRQRLRHLPAEGLPTLNALSNLPFTTPDDLALSPGQFLCTSQDQIQRIVTLTTSGTIHPKRLFFTTEDLEQSATFFAAGVLGVINVGQTMVIALPGARQESVGLQLSQGIERVGIHAVVAGDAGSLQSLLDHIEQAQADCIIGSPTWMLALAYAAETSHHNAFHKLSCIVLCNDFVSPSLSASIRERFSGELFEHYGMTETGMGFAIDCHAHAGYHFREADYLVEIVDPHTSALVPDGSPGELVLTTLRRRGMPLIRYRTGDRSARLSAPCACGSQLCRLQRVSGRICATTPLEDISITEVDDLLFAIPGVIDYRLLRRPDNDFFLQIATASGWSLNTKQLRAALERHEVLHRALSQNKLTSTVINGSEPLHPPSTKRRIMETPRP